MEPGDISRSKVNKFLDGLNGPNGKIGKSQLSINMGCNDTICGIQGELRESDENVNCWSDLGLGLHSRKNVDKINRRMRKFIALRLFH